MDQPWNANGERQKQEEGCGEIKKRERSASNKWSWGMEGARNWEIGTRGYLLVGFLPQGFPKDITSRSAPLVRGHLHFAIKSFAIFVSKHSPRILFHFFSRGVGASFNSTS